jgi:molecular chaperone GrpE
MDGQEVHQSVDVRVESSSSVGAEQVPAEPIDVDAEPELEPVEAELDLEALQARAAQADEYLALAQRAQADFENYRKRMMRDVAAAESRGIGRLVRELLPALDNLERALAAAETDEQEHQLVEGIRLVQAELLAALARSGVQGFSPAGEAFDPVQHEAMAQLPVEGHEPGTIVEVLQSGYRLDETVLRPARVVVAA